ncbi:MAG: dATP/dGTP diphosphohydrolase domain-containing protein [Desulfobulbia bacterium]
MNEFVAEGDLNSDEKGSGARMNSGKPQLDLIPVRHLRQWWEDEYGLTEYHPKLSELLLLLTEWQMDESDSLPVAWMRFPYAHRPDVVEVLEYGSGKYAAWNWAKGQRWGCTLGSLLRHVECVLKGEEMDEESGCRHWGHIGANLLFLLWFQDNYPEGDDRPPVFKDEPRFLESV